MSFSGRVHSAETKAKISSALVGNKNAVGKFLSVGSWKLISERRRALELDAVYRAGNIMLLQLEGSMP